MVAGARWGWSARLTVLVACLLAATGSAAPGVTRAQQSDDSCLRGPNGLSCSGPENGKCLYNACYCRPGRSGKACESEACHPRCSVHGECKDGKCECDPGWGGELCVRPECPTVLPESPCSGHGVCERNPLNAAFPNKRECYCHPAWRGRACELVGIVPDDMSRYGSILFEDGTIAAEIRLPLFQIGI